MDEQVPPRSVLALCCPCPARLRPLAQQDFAGKQPTFQLLAYVLYSVKRSWALRLGACDAEWRSSPHIHTPTPDLRMRTWPRGSANRPSTHASSASAAVCDRRTARRKERRS